MARTAAKCSIHMDAMRAIAAFVVFAGHARHLFIGTMLGAIGLGPNAVPAVSGVQEFNDISNVGTGLGHEAVIVFFVLSGYFVGGGAVRAWRRNIWTWREYAIQRLSRLWIVLIPALVLTLVLDYLGIHLFGLGGIYGGPAGQGSIFPNILSRLNVTAFLGTTFFVQTILTSGLGSNSPLWTLAYEFWFYVAFPLCLGALTQRLARHWRVVCGLALILVGLFVGLDIAKYFLIWLIGVSLQLVPKRLSPRQVSVLAPTTLIVLLATLAYLMNIKTDRYLLDCIEAVACWLFCYVILHETEPAGESLYGRASRLFSDMSYTVYVNHQPIITFICAALMPVWFRWKLDLEHLVYFLGVVALSFIVMCVMYLAFERHTEGVRRILRTYFGRQPANA